MVRRSFLYTACTAALAHPSVMGARAASTTANREESHMEIRRHGTQPSKEGPSDWFTGETRIDPLFDPHEPARAGGVSVRCEPGARTACHTHPLGQILIVTSGLGRVQTWGRPPAAAVYCATKFAVRALSERLRQEVKPYNIRTTVISPGAVATELLEQISETDIADSTQAVVDAIAIPADSFARMVAFAISQPEEVDVNEILFRPTRQEV
jgi:NAD(P)-dependent dehydrogenase (short-subunit alcohol dehydrogenase family)